MATYIISDNKAEYIKSIGEFANLLEGVKVKCIAMVALIDGPGESHDASAYWGATPYDLMSMGNVLTTDGQYEVIANRLDDDMDEEDKNYEN